MGMFTIGSYTESVELLGSTVVAQECFEDNMHTAALRAVAESENNWNQIMQAVAIQELNAYETTGDADTYVEEATNGFLGSVRSFFVKLLEKIKGIFNKFIAVIDQWTKSDKDFVKKYRSKIFTVDYKNFKYNGFKFTYTATFNVTDEKAKAAVKEVGKFSDYNSASSKARFEEIVKNYNGDSLEDKLDAYRGEVIGKVSTKSASGDITSSDFSKELFKALRDGESSKVELEPTPDGEIAKIEKTEDIKKKAKAAYDAMDKAISDAIKDTDSLATGIKNFEKNGEAKGAYIRAVGAVTGFMKNIQSINTIAYGAYLDAVKAENRQAKAICVKLMSYKVKNESTSYYEEGSSLLGNIRMI